MIISMDDLIYIAPEITVAFFACLILVLERSLSDLSKSVPSVRWISYILCQLSLLIALFFTLRLINLPNKELFNNTFIMDKVGNAIKIILYLYGLIAFTYARKYVWERHIYAGEYFVLCLFSILGMMVLVSARSFLTLYLGLELFALPLYALIAMSTKEEKRAPEAAMKYFVMGAIASGMLLYGISLLYGATGSIEIASVAKALSSQAALETTHVSQTAQTSHASQTAQTVLSMTHPSMPVLLGIVFVIIGLAFKFGAVPFHMWVPDIYQGSMTSVTLFIGSLPKLAAFGMAIRLLLDSFSSLYLEWQQLLVLMSILSLAIGNIVAIAQTNLKRMLAYSTIGHVGYMLLGLLAGPEAGYSAAFAYVIIYALMALGAFGVIIALSHEGFEAENIADFQGLGSSQPWVAFLLLLVLFSLAGIPPTLGFYAKFLVLDALVQAGYIWLAAVAVLFSVIGAYYYLRVIRVMFFEIPHEHHPHWQQVSGTNLAFLSCNGLLMLALGIYPTPIINYCLSVWG